MTFQRLSRLPKLALIATIGLLGACETVTTPSQAADVADLAPVDIIEATGAGVFFPPPVSFDTHQVRFGTMAGVGPTERQLFIDRINLTATASGQSVPIAAQSVGDDRKTLVFMLLGSDGPTTPYMARAILARLTSITRFAPEIAEMGLSSEFDIYNMAAVLGFQQIVVTDGRAFAHQAHLTRN